MIKIHLFIALILISIPSLSQSNKGRIMINGSGNYLQNKNDYWSSDNTSKSTYIITQFGSSLKVGYFLTNRFALGIDGGINSYKTKQINTTGGNPYKNSTINYRPGIFMRYNQPILNDKFGIFLTFTTNYELEKGWKNNFSMDMNGNVVETITHSKGTGYSTALSPGLYYFLNNRLSMEMVLGNFSYYDIKTTSPEDPLTIKRNKEFSSNFSISNIYLGVTFYFGKNKNVTPSSETNK